MSLFPSHDPEEGDIITFPAHLLHKSKPNGDKRKTVISFNSNFLYEQGENNDIQNKFNNGV